MLIDRSTARITTGQRVSLNSVEASNKEERDGTPYFVFEHVSQVGVCLFVRTRGCAVLPLGVCAGLEATARPGSC